MSVAGPPGPRALFNEACGSLRPVGVPVRGNRAVKGPKVFRISGTVGSASQTVCPEAEDDAATEAHLRRMEAERKQNATARAWAAKDKAAAEERAAERAAARAADPTAFTGENGFGFDDD